MTWAVPGSLTAALIGHLPEVMLAGLDDQGHGEWTYIPPTHLLQLAEGKDAMAIGPGIGRFLNDQKWLQAIWEGTELPLVLDADALNMMSDDLSNWSKRNYPTILTPHPGEMARLTKRSVADIQRDRIGVAREFAMRHGVILVLKGARSLIAAPDGSVFINLTGNPGMATGGAGDVLTGMLASLLAQGYDAALAACLAVYWHGKAGDQAVLQHGERGLIASDLIEQIGRE